MSAASESIDAALRREATWERADDYAARFGDAIGVYGASVGSVRASIRDHLRARGSMNHDDAVALGSELWSEPVYERRLAAIVLLQTHVALLDNGDLTRLEGFVRGARIRELVDPLAIDVIRPLVLTLEEPASSRAAAVLDRWAADADGWLRRASRLAAGDATGSISPAVPGGGA